MVPGAPGSVEPRLLCRDCGLEQAKVSGKKGPFPAASTTLDALSSALSDKPGDKEPVGTRKIVSALSSSHKILQIVTVRSVF